MIKLIYACDLNNGIGKNGALPWNIPEDMKHFRETTDSSIVIMGRKTWDSIPKQHRPLKDRINIILSRSGSIKQTTQVHVFNSIDKVLEFIGQKHFVQTNKFVIGGASIYKQFLDLGLISEIYQSIIGDEHSCDRTLEILDIADGSTTGWIDDGKLTLLRPATNPPMCTMRRLIYQNTEEDAFLSLLGKVVNEGSRRDTRAGPALSIFAKQLRFDLSTGHIPLLTTRPIPLRLVFYELMWILSGSTDVTWLHKYNVHIWDDNANAAFLKKRGLPNKEWDIGPAYGFAMRHHGAKYIDCHTDYKGRGFDQLANVIKLLQEDPTNRRIMIDLWNPSDTHKMALPPCAYNYQFWTNGASLNCALTQRSSDIALAGGWNIATASLLTILLARVTGMTPGEVVWCPKDIHIYVNQVDAVKEQLSRRPTGPFPRITFRGAPTLPGVGGDITKFLWEHICLQNYTPHPRIKFTMNP